MIPDDVGNDLPGEFAPERGENVVRHRRIEAVQRRKDVTGDRAADALDDALDRRPLLARPAQREEPRLHRDQLNIVLKHLSIQTILRLTVIN